MCFSEMTKQDYTNLFDIKTIYTNDNKDIYKHFGNVTKLTSYLSTSSNDDDLGRIVGHRLKKWWLTSGFGDCICK